MPDDGDRDRRLELASRLRHRPLSVLTDRPALPGDAADALWQAHLARALAEVRRLRVGLPRPGLARYDRRALRGGLVVALVAALAIAGSDAPARLARALEPDWPAEAAAPSTQLQAWITPPAYTRLAPLFLKNDGGPVCVPAGSHLTVSVTGGEGEPSLSLAGHAEPFRELDATSFQAERDLLSGGRLEVRRHGRELATWDLTVVADQPPTAAWTEPPGQAARSLQARLPWRASDDYGVTHLQAELRLKDRPAPRRSWSRSRCRAAAQRPRRASACRTLPRIRGPGFRSSPGCSPRTRPARAAQARRRSSCCPSGRSSTPSPAR